MADYLIQVLFKIIFILYIINYIIIVLFFIYESLEPLFRHEQRVFYLLASRLTADVSIAKANSRLVPITTHFEPEERHNSNAT